ncbi:NUDIX hydrolase [Sphingomicrobium clamense]|uniref:NUDIX hydrolase n=1 Tax=Sphingomicrobium clamense TaxID=2851013 RepID=A0ABS6V522_9SPHN|nr:NUDIX hydrolase [Sphingomicrobium sp. B8]MBW0144657.1 NUDIX hydrolase [Sphingomicrobium sp. B8]
MSAVTRGRWEYVKRVGGMSAVAIEAIVDGRILLVEQYREPLGRNCLELPAGLVGDDDGKDDTPESAAIRELEEETGYRPGRVETVGHFYSSPGILSEGFTLVRAHDCVKVGDGGGVEGEEITVHEVPLAQLPAFCDAKREEGCALDVRVMAMLLRASS